MVNAKQNLVGGNCGSGETAAPRPLIGYRFSGSDFRIVPIRNRPQQICRCGKPARPPGNRGPIPKLCATCGHHKRAQIPTNGDIA